MKELINSNKQFLKNYFEVKTNIIAVDKAEVINKAVIVLGKHFQTIQVFCTDASTAGYKNLYAKCDSADSDLVSGFFKCYKLVLSGEVTS